MPVVAYSTGSCSIEIVPLSDALATPYEKKRTKQLPPPGEIQVTELLV